MIQYVTGVLAVILVTVHLLLQGVLVPYSQAISFNQVLSLYRNLFYSSLLELLLVVILIHGFNGLRIILLELRQGKSYEDTINAIIFVVTIAMIIYGTRTIVLAMFGGLS